MSVYIGAWFTYAAISFLAFPFLSLTTFLFSIPLTMLAAWSYGISGCIVTTLLSIPFHYMILVCYSDDPSMHSEALNPFGITTQLVLSGSIAYLRITKSKIDQINYKLELLVSKRTSELKKLQHYIINNQDTSHAMLSHILLEDIGKSLADIQIKSERLTDQLTREKNPAADRAGKLSEMVKASLDAVDNLEFVERYYQDRPVEYATAIESVKEHFEETAGVRFELVIQTEPYPIPLDIQHHLYRISREAITNAVRHANATCIEIKLDSDQNLYRLTIINDGKSMPTHIKRGMGLTLMQHRIERLGGNLVLGTTSGKKTELTCMIPRASD
jgi:signal transduction histidine kinase